MLERLRALLRGRPLPEGGPAAGGSAAGSSAEESQEARSTPQDADGEALVLPDGGLTAAVEALAAAQPVPVATAVDVPAGLSAAVELAAYRAVEAHLADAVAAGTAPASVVVTYDDGVLRVEVTDAAWRVRVAEVPTRP